MSSHSRSSSEIVAPHYSDILPVFFDAFRKDFDFYDVKDDVKHLFTKEEFQSIINETTEFRQLVLLFEILKCKEQVIPEFLDCIKHDYPFLSDPIKKEYNEPREDTAIYVDKVRSLKSTYTKHTDFNVFRIEQYIALQKALRRVSRYQSVILEGELGQGKKWLCINVCYSFAVMKAMDFKIYWLDVSDCTSPEQDLDRLQTLQTLLLGDCNGTTNGFTPIYQQHVRATYNESILNRKLELQHWLREKLKQADYKNCLVILKDVQNFKTFQTFNLGCKLLIITRNKKVCESFTPKMSTRIRIANGLTLPEFYSLFEKYLDQTRDKFPKNAIDIYNYSNGHPYLLSIIAQNLRQRKSTWNEWIRNLQNQKIVNDKFLQVVNISLNVLSKEELKLYETLGVFKSSVPIPIKLLAVLWNKSLHDTDHIMNRFNQFSFVSIVPCNSDDDSEGFCGCCVVPFVYSSHLKSERLKAKINDKELHAKIIEYYKIEQTFAQRTEIDLCSSLHDQYFFSYIGDHLLEAGRTELFPMIYFDFGFLEQKIRAVGLSNTIIDLKRFDKEITSSDYRNEELLSDIRDFLPKIEEKLTESRDTSLLQYALLATGSIYEEAIRQMRRFPNRVWFSERGNFHKRRQIVSIMDEAKDVCSLDQDMCHVVLKNGNMQLLDISLDCTSNPIFLKNDTTILEVRRFRDNKFILALDDSGALKVWSITDDHRHGLVQRRSSRQKVHSFNFHNKQKMTSRSFKQKIHQNSMGQHGYIVAFFIDQWAPPHNNDTYLHVAFKNGDISVYKWNSIVEEFLPEQIPILQTKENDIKFLTKILDSFYLIISKKGNLTTWYLRDSSKKEVTFDWPKNPSEPLSYELKTYKTDQLDQLVKVYTRLIFVFPDKVLSVTFEHKDLSREANGQVEILYKNQQNFKSAITCAKLTDDGHYLVLGTKRGLIVYDIIAKSEMLRSNVSDAVACVDIYPLYDNIFKYVIICGVEHRKALYIFSVRTNGENGITWAHNVTSMGNEDSGGPQLEADVWLLGQKLYDINYKSDGSTHLMAVDSKFRVHQLNTTKTKSWSIIMPKETSEAITSITTGNEQEFVGYISGKIFNIINDAFEKDSMNNAITYLQILDDRHLIASTKTQTSIRKVDVTDSPMKIFDFDTKQCYKVREHYILLISELGNFMVIDNDYEPRIYGSLCENDWDTTVLCGCDFQNDHLCLASTSFVKMFRFLLQENPPKIFLIVNEPVVSIPQAFLPNAKNHVTCIALTKDATIVAIAYTNGDIALYKLQDRRLNRFYLLQSHRSCIFDMKFSPGNEVLASCGEQLCLWNMLYVQNNPFTKNSPNRRSSRFSSQRSYENEEVDAKPVSHHDTYLNTHSYEQNDIFHVEDNSLLNAINGIQFSNGNGNGNRYGTIANAWRDKQGPADKPELLSCIKFDGRKAEKLYANPDFTQFNTIDDEGVYYHLVLFDDDDDIENLNSLSSLNGELFNITDMTTTCAASNIDEGPMDKDEVYE